ncbi:transposase [Candidatus Latescibacterota bacterium]
MDASHGNQLTGSSEEARFFLEPVKPLQRQYEALRAYFVEGLPSHEVAARFGYSPGSFRVLCHQFRRDSDRQERFFRDVRRGPQTAPARDRVRELVVAMRKRNLSVYDIQRELRTQGQDLSINSLSILLREEGFTRLPRRPDEERPATTKPETAAAADVRRLDLAPRAFRTRVAGLFLFVPLMRHLDLARVAEEARLPGTVMIPAEQALRSLLALKLIGKERKSHVMNLVFDQGLALFAGLNVIPKRSYLAAYSSRLGRRANVRLMETWFQHVQQIGLRHSGSLDVDFHTVPANTAKEPLQNHYLPKRGHRQPGVLVFLARDAEERVLCYANAGVAKEHQADEILHFVDFWKRRTGQVPTELVFDSGLTTHPNLGRLNEQGIHFLTLRRRSRPMLAQIYGQPAAAWRRVTLPSLSRTYRHPRVLDGKVTLKGYGDQPLRQLSVMDLGHEEPTVILTNDFRSRPATLITRYAHRMLIENGIAEAIHFFHLDALSSMVGLKVDFDLQITLMGSALYHLLANHLAEAYRRATAKSLFSNLLDVGGLVEIGTEQITVTVDKHAHNPYLVDSGLANHPTPMPWLADRELVLRFA